MYVQCTSLFSGIWPKGVLCVIIIRVWDFAHGNQEMSYLASLNLFLSIICSFNFLVTCIFQKEHQWLSQSQYTNGSSCMFSSVWSLNHIGGSEIEVLASWSVIYSCLECLDPPPSSQLSKRLALYIWLQTLWRHLMQIFLKSWNLIESFVKATHASCSWTGGRVRPFAKVSRRNRLNLF